MSRRNYRIFDLIFLVILASLFAALSPIAWAQKKPIPKRAGSAQPAQPTPGAADQVRYKGIFEPVNYPDDLNLRSVFFSSENEGWASAEHGTIIHTSDAGKTWQAQLGGDTASAEGTINLLRFLDRKHGWAQQLTANSPLLHTRDGVQWIRTGSFPDGGAYDYTFTSETNGVYIPSFLGSNRSLRHTTDGGKTWKKVAECAAKFPVQGLMTNVGCELRSIAFPTSNIGYAVGVGADALFVLKTSDGGATWSISVVPDMAPGFQPRLESFFMDPNHGFVAVGTKLLTTSNGGQNWTSIAGASIPGAIHFADPEVGWSMYSELSYTTDGGRNWTLRRVSLPATVQGVSLPKRDVAYVVGDHGMVYRYHIVPVDYKVANGVDAPAMPGTNVALNSQLQRIKTDVAALQTKLGTVGGSGSPGGGAVSANSTDGSTTFSAQPANGSSASVDSSTAAGTAIAAQPADSSGMATTSPSDNGTGTGASGSSSTSDNGFGTSASIMTTSTNTSAAPAGGDAFTQDAAFTQDTSGPPSPAIQSCCGADIGKLQGEVNSFMQQVPTASRQSRNLNLLIAGARMVSDLFTKAKGFKDAFVTLKKSTNMQTASAALQDLVSKLDGVGQTLSSGFQNPPPLPDIGGFSGASSVAGQAFSASPADGSATGTAAAGTAQDPNAPANTKKDSLDDKTKEIKDKLKKKFKIPF